MIIIFLGPPYSGKDTQAKMLSQKLSIPCFSMGELIREGNRVGNPKAIEGYQQYVIKGFHVPNSLKFDLLKEKMDENKKGFILDNYPATQEDLVTLNEYLSKNSLQVDKVFLINISVGEMKQRMIQRAGGEDDKPEIILERRKIQDEDRIPVIEYFKGRGLLSEIHGEGSVDDIQSKIEEALNDYN